MSQNVRRRAANFTSTSLVTVRPNMYWTTYGALPVQTALDVVLAPICNACRGSLSVKRCMIAPGLYLSRLSHSATICPVNPNATTWSYRNSQTCWWGAPLPARRFHLTSQLHFPARYAYVHQLVGGR